MPGTVVREVVAAMRAATTRWPPATSTALTLLRTAGRRRRRTGNPDLPTAHPKPPHPGPTAGRDHAQGDGRQILEGRAPDPVPHLQAAKPHRRLTLGRLLLGPRRNFTGQPLPPCCRDRRRPSRSGDQPRARQGHPQVDRQVAGFRRRATRDQVEADLVATAVGGPQGTRRRRRADSWFLLDQDGPAPDDAERDR